MGRIRLPSSRARENAETEASELEESVTTPGKKKSTMTSFSEMEEEEFESSVVAEREEGSGPSNEGSQEEDNTLYCICLGKDDLTSPMIQCEFCTNW